MNEHLRNALLAVLFERAAEAGYGFARPGPSFEAIPGLEDAAADFIEGLLYELTGLRDPA